MTTDLTTYQVSAACQRLRAAALLSGLTEPEAQFLLDAQVAGMIQILTGTTPEDHRVTSDGGEACSLLAWAFARSAPDAIVLSFDVIHWLAYFADQRAEEELFVGVAQGYAAAVLELLTIAGARERFDIAANADPQQVYNHLVERGLITYAPNPYTLLDLQDARSSGPEQ